MKKILVLDDEASRHEGFDRIFGGSAVHAYNLEDFEAALPAGPYDLICLDHDLGSEGAEDNENVILRKTGMDAVKALVALPAQLRPKQVLVHSHNSIEGPKMVKVLQEAGITAARNPYKHPHEVKS